MGFVEPSKYKWVIDRATGRRVKKGARDTKWKARYPDPTGKDRSKTFPRKADAEKFLERVGSNMQKGDWIDPRADKSRFDDWVEVWWKTTVKLTPSTRRGYDKILRLHLQPHFRGRRITSIDWVEVELLASTLLESGLSTKTVRETLSVLSQIMKTAVRARAIRENSAAGHSLPTRRQRTKVLTMQQVDELVAHTDERYRAAIWLLVLAGLRPSELCGLRVTDVDWDGRTISINEVQMWVKGEFVVKGPKTVTGLRTIPLPEWLIADLRDQVDRRADASGNQCRPRTAHSPHRPASRCSTTRCGGSSIARLTERASIKFAPTTFAHSHASLLIDIGAHPKAISERMGHTEIGVTMNVYGHLFDGKQRELTENLDDLLDRTRSNATSDRRQADAQADGTQRAVGAP